MAIHIKTDSSGGTSIESSSNSNISKTTSTRETSIACKETTDHLTLEVDLPGVEAKDLNVSLTGRRLSVSYQSDREEKTQEGGVERITRVQETRKKEVDLPLDVDPMTADAVYKRGTLVVKLRKRPAEHDAGERVVVNVS